METLIKTVQENWMQYAMALLGVLVTIVLAQILTRVLRRVIAATYKRRAERLTSERARKMETASSIIQSISKYLVWFLAAAAIVGQLGLTTTMSSMLTAAGVGGLALGIGAQSFIKDVVAGMFFLFEDQAAVGDYITAAEVTGTLEEISLRTIVVKGFRGEQNIIPHGTVGVMTNYSRSNYLALLEIDIMYEEDIARASSLMLEEAEIYAKECEAAVEAPEVLGITALKKSGVTVRLALRVKPMMQWSVERALRARVIVRLVAEGVRMPYPKLIIEQAQNTQSAGADIRENAADEVKA